MNPKISFGSDIKSGVKEIASQESNGISIKQLKLGPMCPISYVVQKAIAVVKETPLGFLNHIRSEQIDSIQI